MMRGRRGRDWGGENETKDGVLLKEKLRTIES